MRIPTIVMTLTVTVTTWIPLEASEPQTTATTEVATAASVPPVRADEMPAVASPPVRMNNYQPTSINQVPILNRPDRPGHPVGNTIRRINRGNSPIRVPVGRWRPW